MEKSDRPKPPFSLRLTFEERSRLENEAQGMPLGAYIRQRLLEGAPRPKRLRPSPVEDRDALRQVLGLLGQSRLANNVNQLAKAANLGTLPVDPETEEALYHASCDIEKMRKMLMRALGQNRGPW